MVIVRLTGGLGNQMFQYAVGRKVAHVHGVELNLDIFGFESYTLRKYVLGAFNIQEKFATSEEVKALTVRKRGFFKPLIAKAMGRKLVSASSYIREKQFHFDPEIQNLPDNVYLDGYWQSEKYFMGIEDTIRKEFIVKTDQKGKNFKLAELIESCDSVSLHIRRGDHVSDPETQKRYGTCNLDYYHRCIEFLTRFVKKPHFFIFSDDPVWARDNLNLAYTTTFVDHNSEDKNYEDLRLMSQCKHNIIANSSFSWWGAWLNNNPNKLVYAPKRWLADTTAAGDYNAFINNLIPLPWTRV